MVALPPTLHGGLPKPSLQAPSHSAATPPGSAGRDAGTLHLANGDDAEGDPLVGADDTGPSSGSAHGDVTESLRSYARDRIANTASPLRQGRRTAGVMRTTSPLACAARELAVRPVPARPLGELFASIIVFF